ncbi:MAG: hypothetical protein M3323_11480 [Actinomycetota bacterium]|nr:hypothetical protein [Actinomycetota bacterium]
MLGNLAVLGVIAAAAAVPLTAGTAQAESCVTLPGTTGATIEAAGQKVRVPSTSGVGACVEPGGLPGLPRVDSGGTATSVVLGAGSSASGYVVVRYTLDGSPSEVRVPIPGGGGGSETCLASVGAPARADCLVKVSVDEIPTLPPTPTLPPVSPEPLPTVSPEPLPTVPPIGDPWCNETYCIHLIDDPWCNETYCIERPDPICLKTPSICI